MTSNAAIFIIYISVTLFVNTRVSHVVLVLAERGWLSPGPVLGSRPDDRVLLHGTAVVRGGHRDLHRPHRQSEDGDGDVGARGAAQVPGCEVGPTPSFYGFIHGGEAVYGCLLKGNRHTRAARLWKKIIITIILVNIEIPIIQTIIFEFENMMHLFSVSRQKIGENLKKYAKYSNWKYSNRK